MKKISMLFLSALLGASFVLSTAPASAAEDVTVPKTFPAKYAPLVMESSNVHVEDSRITRLSRDQFYARYAEITGKSIAQVKSEFLNSEKTSPEILGDQYYQTYDAEYSTTFDIGGGVKIKAGTLVQIEEFMFGQSTSKRFKQVYDSSGYLAPYSGSFTVIKNFTQGTIQASGKLQISYSGYAETAVQKGSTEAVEVNLDRWEIVHLGWSKSHSKNTTDYYRKHFNGSTMISPN